MLVAVYIIGMPPPPKEENIQVPLQKRTSLENPMSDLIDSSLRSVLEKEEYTTVARDVPAYFPVCPFKSKLACPLKPFFCFLV